MRLTTLISGADISVDPNADCEITGLSLDSRTVKPGDLFAALAGAKDDGLRFVDAAVAKGARAVLVDANADVSIDGSVVVLRAETPRRALACLAARFFAAQPECIVAVTGTSGKTSVADFTRQLLLNAGRSAASIGTIGLIRADKATYGSLTTPDSITLHKTLAGLARDGVTHLAMEASSHGLDQARMDGVRLTAAAFTNLSRDHLDYHADMEAYFDAKLRLFSELLPDDGTAVVHVDDAASARILECARARGLKVIEVGTKAKDVQLVGVSRDGFAQNLSLRVNSEDATVRLGLVGDYQVSNALVAAGLALAVGVPQSDVIAGLGKLIGVAGRLEIIGEVKGALAVVDYAHKPEALDAALRACRPFASGRLIVVFGCGGDRDKGKRPLMGKIAHEAADVVIVTDDNPRSEDPATIRTEVRAGQNDVLEIGGRRQAIRHAIEMCQTGDVVLVAGKGHETGQIIGDDVIAFSDHEEVRAAMEKFGP
ncbi:MAG: UDP-N-acetylmuramoyl-L-alanyl-D-glutamate--2,6-diaminopimelate ligase [Alphaproteobacteria bacterium]|nr:UDP-N-acetylmuramoyl-L-alanyl-D-glutamate--2,6-diaminopimelate ligase [Alphaproteobacteria bacterium]